MESARLLTYRAALRARSDALGNLHHSSMAKLAASEAAGRVVDRAVQVMGRWGLVRDAKIERPKDAPTNYEGGARSARRYGMNRLAERLDKLAAGDQR